MSGPVTATPASRASRPGRLHLPLIQDPVYGYQSVNVEAQTENPSSLLHWTGRMIHIRKGHPAFGLGSSIDLGGSNPSILSYVREHVTDPKTTAGRGPTT